MNDDKPTSRFNVRWMEVADDPSMDLGIKYAYHNKVSPIFHPDEDFWESVCAVKKELVTEVFEFCKAIEDNNGTPTRFDLSQRFGKERIAETMLAADYARLSGRLKTRI